MITNQPSLAELLAAYKNNGAADAINAGVQGIQSGMNIAAQREQARLNQQNELAKQAIQSREAGAKEKEAAAKFMDASDAERIAGAAPGTFGTPGTPVPTSAVTDFLNRKSQQENITAQLKAAQMNKEAQLAQIDTNAKLAAQERQAQINEQAQANRNTAGIAALNNANQHAPGLFQTALDAGYNFFTNKHTPVVQSFLNQQQTGNQLLSGQQPTPQSVLGSNYSPDVIAYAQKHNITPDQAQQIKIQRTQGQ